MQYDLRAVSRPGHCDFQCSTDGRRSPCSTRPSVCVFVCVCVEPYWNACAYVRLNKQLKLTMALSQRCSLAALVVFVSMHKSVLSYGALDRAAVRRERRANASQAHMAHPVRVTYTYMCVCSIYARHDDQAEHTTTTCVFSVFLPAARCS